MDAADLPATGNLARDSVVQVLFATAKGQLIQVAEHERMRDVLIADRFLGTQVVRVLCIKDIGVESRQRGLGGICICDGFREGVGSQQVQTVSEASLQLGLEPVVSRLAEILKPAVGGDVAVLREGTQ